jgi:hypothetical protein
MNRKDVVLGCHAYLNPIGRGILLIVAKEFFMRYDLMLLSYEFYTTSFL